MSVFYNGRLSFHDIPNGPARQQFAWWSHGLATVPPREPCPTAQLIQRESLVAGQSVAQTDISNRFCLHSSQGPISKPTQVHNWQPTFWQCVAESEGAQILSRHTYCQLPSDHVIGWKYRIGPTMPPGAVVRSLTAKITFYLWSRKLLFNVS